MFRGGLALDWYLHRLGSYDKKPWERSVEERVHEAIESLQGFPKKSGKVKAELIDVDLVRGSPFTKAKPQISWITLAVKGLYRLVFSPFCRKWWVRHTSMRFWILMQCLYVAQGAGIGVYFLEEEKKDLLVRLSHVLIPTLLWTVLGLIHSQIVSTISERHERTRTGRKKLSKKRRKPKLFTAKSSDFLVEIGRKSVEREKNAANSDSDKFELRKGSARKLSQDEKVSESSPIPSSESEGEGRSSPDRRTLPERVASRVDIVTSRVDIVTSRVDIVTSRVDVVSSRGDLDLRSGNVTSPDVSLTSPNSQASGEDSLDMNEPSLSDSPVVDLNPAPGSESSSSRQLRQDSAVEADRTELSSEQRETEPRTRNRPDSAGLRRRRRANLKLSIDTKSVPKPDRRKFSCLSSCDSEVDQARTGGLSMPSTSECDWDRVNSDMATSDTSYCYSEDSELSDESDGVEECTHDDPFSWTQHSNTALHNSHTPANDRVSCYIWETNECKKVDLTVLEIGATIIRRVDKIPDNNDYLKIGIFFTVVSSILPLVYQGFTNGNFDQFWTLSNGIFTLHFQHSLATFLLYSNGVIQRFFLAFCFFFLLSVAERTFKQRLWCAKHFCHLTSSRRARIYDLPHFRLKKVRNIRTWLSLRSYLKKCGPQRSIDVIVSTAFILAVTLVALMCFLLLKDSEAFMDSILNWELTIWCLALGIYLLRFMTLGTKINKKYRNFSVLITEQINLYLHMEQKPHKKEDLMLTNNVLKLAEDLLKELESPFKISGLSADSFLYNATKVIILSAFSAVLTELLGFKLKLYKIKIKT